MLVKKNVLRKLFTTQQQTAVILVPLSTPIGIAPRWKRKKSNTRKLSILASAINAMKITACAKETAASIIRLSLMKGMEHMSR